jgi:protein-S-isoprenylcysteine O-methyltransferase Ste14
MNAFILAVPIILIRYGLMALISREAIGRAAHFPPVIGRERIALCVYQVTMLILFGYLAFLRVTLDTATHWVGLIVYVMATVLYAKSVIDFSRPLTSGMNSRGLYEYSRNPMYVAFFLYLLGCGLLVGSWIYLAILAVFQVSVHYLILSEERWCLKQFGEDYRRYMRRVRRYL